MKKIKGKNCTWFYCEGWRWGKIVKRYSKEQVTIKHCSGQRFRCRLNKNGKWVALSNKDFKGQNHVRKEEEDVKKKKIKIKRRLKTKITKRKLRKVRKIRKAT